MRVRVDDKRGSLTRLKHHGEHVIGGGVSARALRSTENPNRGTRMSKKQIRQEKRMKRIDRRRFIGD
ncbi:hypothetical protein ACFL2C_03965 [Patescibacteria group bacterium]